MEAPKQVRGRQGLVVARCSKGGSSAESDLLRLLKARACDVPAEASALAFLVQAWSERSDILSRMAWKRALWGGRSDARAAEGGEAGPSWCGGRGMTRRRVRR